MIEKYCKLIKVCLLITFCLLTTIETFAQNTQREQTLELKASVRDINGSLTEVQVCWRGTLPAPTAHMALRKDNGALFWSKGFTVSTNDTCFLDTIPTGTIYEYGVAKDTSVFGNRIYGYITVGNKVDAVLRRGTAILVYDTTYESKLSSAYFNYKKNLIGDGWQIDEFRVDSGTAIATVKAGIVSRYSANPNNVNTVILIGNIKVPYSGDYRLSGNWPPDAHMPQHNGAWPADVYYGDINSSSWTDATVSNSTGSRSANHNTVGDGKFDQSTIPTLIELSVGRIDLSDMPAFSSPEDTLLLNYFDKNHAFRHVDITVPNRALLDENFGLLNGEAFGGNLGYRNIAPMFGYNAVNNLDYLTTLNTDYYKWSFGFGAGNYGSMTGVGVTSNFASSSQNVRSIFNVFFGSYFIDWDNSNNFLRAPLAAKGSVLTSVGGGRPNLFFHPMAMGATIGYSFKESQNNYNTSTGTDLYTSYHFFSRYVTTALMGDPTLRLNYVRPISNLYFCKDSANSDTMRMFWTSPSGVNVNSYYVFRGTSALDSFLLVGETTDTFFNDTISNHNQEYYYMIRVSAYDTTCSGNYLNLSQGVCGFTDFIDKIGAHDTAYFCTGDSVRIGNAIGAAELAENYSYSWSPSSTVSNADSAQSWAKPLTTTTYYLTTKDKFGFTVLDTFVTIFVGFPSTGINLNSQSIVCGDTVELVSNPAPVGMLNYSWTVANSIPSSVVGTNLNGPHTFIFTTAGTNRVDLSILYNDGNCTYRDSLGVVVACITLPVELIEFKAVEQGENVLVTWATATEINNNFFELERSYDGENFEFVANVPSKAFGGNSNQTLQYLLLDEVEKNRNIVFYRITQEDFNGTRKTFPFTSTDLSTEILWYPNPVGDRVYLTQKDNVKSVEILSVQGKVLLSINSSSEIDVSQLPKGIYYMRMYLDNGIYTKKFLKE